MTHPERKAVSDEREMVIANLERHVEGGTFHAHACEYAVNALRADAEKDETIAQLRSYNETLTARCVEDTAEMGEKDETIRRLREDAASREQHIAAAFAHLGNRYDITSEQAKLLVMLHAMIAPCGEVTDADVAWARESYAKFIAKRNATLAATASPAPDTKDGEKS